MLVKGEEEGEKGLEDNPLYNTEKVDIPQEREGI